jgi:hypothetical protein
MLVGDVRVTRHTITILVCKSRNARRRQRTECSPPQVGPGAARGRAWAARRGGLPWVRSGSSFAARRGCRLTATASSSTITRRSRARRYRAISVSR